MPIVLTRISFTLVIFYSYTEDLRILNLNFAFVYCEKLLTETFEYWKEEYFQPHVLTLRQALKVIATMLRGLSFLHEERTVDGELKPCVVHRFLLLVLIQLCFVDAASQLLQLVG